MGAYIHVPPLPYRGMGKYVRGTMKKSPLNLLLLAARTLGGITPQFSLKMAQDPVL